MVSSRTENRNRKLKYLENWARICLKVTVLTHTEREGVNMAEYKKIDSLLKKLFEDSAFDKKRVQKFLHTL